MAPSVRLADLSMPHAEPPRTDDETGASPQSAAVVAALWHSAPPGTEFGAPAGALRTLAAHLEQVAESSRRLRDTAATDDARGLQLLADTADVLRTALTDPHLEEWQAPPKPELPWPARLRLARLERWLSARSELEPGAAAAADLCLWLAEHIEAVQR